MPGRVKFIAALFLLGFTFSPALAQPPAPRALTLFRVAAQETTLPTSSDFGNLRHSVSVTGNSFIVNLTYSRGGPEPGTGSASLRVDTPATAFTSFAPGVTSFAMTPPGVFPVRLAVAGTGPANFLSATIDSVVADPECQFRAGGTLGTSRDFTCSRRVLNMQTIEGRRVARLDMSLIYGFSSLSINAYYEFEPFITDSITFNGPVLPEIRKLVKGSKATFSAKVSYRLLGSSRANLALRIFDKPADGDLQGSSDFVLIRERTTNAGRDHPDALQIVDFEVPKGLPKIYLQAVLIDDVNPRVLARSTPIEFSTVVKVSISRAEIVQVVQTENNDIPLFEGKETVIRAFIKQEPADPVVSGLEGQFRGGLSRVMAAVRVLNDGPLTAHATPERRNGSHSFNFAVSGPINLSDYEMWIVRAGPADEEIEIEHTSDKPFKYRGLYLGFDRLFFSGRRNEERTRGYREFDSFSIRVIPVCVRDPAGAGPELCPAPPSGSLAQSIMDILPGERRFSVTIESGAKFYPGDLAPPLSLNLNGDDKRRQEDELNARFMTYLKKLWREADVKDDMIVAFVSGDLNLRLDGYAETPFARGGQGRVAWVRDVGNRNANRWTMAHEIGHNLGLHHTNTSDGCSLFAADSKTNWNRAYPDGRGTTHEVGFDITNRQVMGPDKFDFMTYCSADSLWVSPFHYRQMDAQLFQYMQTMRLVDLDQAAAQPASNTQTSRAAAAPRSADPVERLLVSGWVARDGSAAGFDPVYRSMSARLGDESDPAGDHCLVLHGAEGKLGEHCFGIEFEDFEEGTLRDRAFFAADIAAPAGFNRLELVRGSQSLAELRVAEPPSIRILSPGNGGRLEVPSTLEWEASGGDLVFKIDSSVDGGATWSPLVIDFAGRAYPLDPRKLSAGGSYFFRVTAASGLNSASAVVGPIEVVQRAALDLPTSPLAFGETRVNTPLARNVELRSSGSGPLRVESIEVTGAGFAALNLRLPLTIAPGGSETLPITFNASAAGRYSGQVRLVTNATPAERTLVLEASATDPNAPRLVPPATAALDFGDVTAGQTRDLPLVLRNTGGSALAIASVTSSNPLFRVTAPAIPATVAAGGQVTLTVRFAPAAAGAQTGTLAVQSNDPLLPRFEAALRGVGIAATGPPPGPPAPTTPTTAAVRLDFGEVAIGRSAELELTMNNGGATVATASSAVFSNSVFSGSPAAPFAIPANGQRVYTVRFTPAATGVQTGTVTFAFSGAGTLVVNLVGVGLPALPTTPPPTTPPPTGPRTVTLQVDDGVFERILSLPAGGDAFFINRITPPSYPATLRAVQVFFGDQGLLPGDGVTILSAGHPSGAPELASPRFANAFQRITTQAQFQEFAVQPVTIESGDFLVGFVVSADAGLPIMPQDLSNYRSRSYLSRNGTVFELINAVPGGGQGNFAIRGVVEVR